MLEEVAGWFPEHDLGGTPWSNPLAYQRMSPSSHAAELGRYKTPTLVICGEEDQLTPPKYSRFLGDHIAGARVVVVAGAGHYVQVEQPDETTAAMREFLVRLRHREHPA